MFLVHGKRRPKRETRKNHTSSSHHRLSKQRSQTATVQKAVALQRIQRHHMRSEAKMEHSPVNDLSNLERLPIELIQEIFFHALEMNMARTSRHLSQVLSTKPILQALTALAYFDDDGESPVEPKHFLPATYRLLSLEEKVYLQQSISSLKWFTYEHIQSCLPKLARLVMAQAWHREYASEVSIRQETLPEEELVIDERNEALYPYATLPELDNELDVRAHFIALTLDLGSSPRRVMRGESFDSRSLRIFTWTCALCDNGTYLKQIDSALSILGVRHIPSWLLRSNPWTEERVKFLQLLRQSFISLRDDVVMAISAKAVFDGMETALVEHNVMALTTLLEIHNSFFQTAIRTSPNPIENRLTLPSHHPIPLELFHLALRQGSHTATLLPLLLRADISSIPTDDETLTAWALHASAHGSNLASWLLREMTIEKDHRWRSGGYLFVNGARRGVIMGRGLPFPDTSFADELGYIKGLGGLVNPPAGLNGRICGED